MPGAAGPSSDYAYAGGGGYRNSAPVPMTFAYAAAQPGTSGTSGPSAVVTPPLPAGPPLNRASLGT